LTFFFQSVSVAYISVWTIRRARKTKYGLIYKTVDLDLPVLYEEKGVTCFRIYVLNK